jgi:phosphatidylserine decarboxylase
LQDWPASGTGGQVAEWLMAADCGRGEAQWTWPAIHPEGRKFGLIGVILALLVLLWLDWEIIGWPMLGLAIFVFAFFRDPERVVPQGPDLIVSPADGLVSLIVQVPPPPELQLDDESGRGLGTEPVTRVSIFMSVFDVHINRAPVAGPCGGSSIFPASSSTPTSTRRARRTSASMS